MSFLSYYVVLKTRVPLIIQMVTLENAEHNNPLENIQRSGRFLIYQRSCMNVILPFYEYSKFGLQISLLEQVQLVGRTEGH